MLFDGASLALYIVGIVVYITNIVKGMRMASSGVYANEGNVVVDASHPFTPAFEGKGVGREDSLRVLSASHTILALVLVGVLVLQAGQWYAERKEGQERDKVQPSIAGGIAGKGKSGGNGGNAKDKKRA